MSPKVSLRHEKPADRQAIHGLTAAAFAPMGFSDGSEAGAIDIMRDTGELTLSLVAETDRIIGHVAFSPAQISGADGDWYGLGPISVAAPFQRRGIGTRLTHAGLDALTSMGATGCILTGNPDIYEPMGFSRDHGLTYNRLNPKFILYWCPSGTAPSGEVNFTPALEEQH